VTCTVTERSPGVWWLRAYVGRSSSGKPLRVSRTVRGGKRLAQAELAKLVTEVAERAGEATSKKFAMRRPARPDRFGPGAVRLAPLLLRLSCRHWRPVRSPGGVV
jgi:hypothetical protein